MLDHKPFRLEVGLGIHHADPGESDCDKLERSLTGNLELWTARDREVYIVIEEGEMSTVIKG